MHHLFPLAEQVTADIAAVPEGGFDKLMYGLNIAVIGLGTVFSVLLIIMCVLYLFRLFFYTLPNRKKAEAAPETKPAAVTKTVASPAAEDDELVPVVIAAAVAAYMENTAPHSKYRIRSFKRI